MHSLRTKIVLLTTCVTVAAVAVISLISVLFIRGNEHLKSDQLLLFMCETGRRNLDYYFDSVEKSANAVAAFTEEDLDGLDSGQLRDHVERVRPFFGQAANKTDGVLTYYYRIDPSVSPDVEGFWYTDLNGRGFVEHTVTDITQYDTEDTTKLVWFTVPKHTGRPIWLPPYMTDNLDVKVISYNCPIYWQGRFVGVIGIEIDYSTMAEEIESIRLYNNGYAFLTDDDGNILFHPRIDPDQLPEGENPEVPDGLLSDSTFSHYTYEGTEREAAWLRLSNGMRLYVSVPVNETKGNWQQLTRSILAASAAILILAILVSLLVAARITRPLKQLTEAAAMTDQEDYDFILDYKGNDELGALTQSFTRMAGHIREHIRDLNRRVYVDSLTSVRNKGAYSAYLEEMQRDLDADPEAMEYAICMFDCDDLKTVNDTCGHDKGDVYLKTVSNLICRVFQHSPVFRVGGDEFTVILQNDDYHSRADLIREFEETAARINVPENNSWEQIHVSMGIAVFDRKHDHSVIDTVRRADKNMYADKRSKKTGRQSASPK